MVSIQINPLAGSQKYLYEDARGFVKFKLCRTSDLEKKTVDIEPLLEDLHAITENEWREYESHEELDKEQHEKRLAQLRAEHVLGHFKLTQRTKITLLTYFKDRLGLIGLREFLVDHQWDHSQFRLVSFKQVYFSKNLLQQ